MTSNLKGRWFKFLVCFFLFVCFLLGYVITGSEKGYSTHLFIRDEDTVIVYVVILSMCIFK